jgi:hypothetical protein
MGRSHTRLFRDVSMTQLGESRVLIEGGLLTPEEGWIAPIVQQDGKQYFAVATACKVWNKLVGKPLTFSKFVERLTTLRNDATDQALLKLATERGERVKTREGGFAWYKMTGGKSALASVPECPTTVNLSVEFNGMNDDEPVEESLEVLLNTNGNAAPSIMLTPHVLNHLARTLRGEAARAEAADRGRKRPRSNREEFAYPEIRYRARQRALYVSCRNADGKLVRHQVPLPRDHDQDKQREIEDSLHAHYNLNHHGEPITEENDVEEQAMEEDEAMEEDKAMWPTLMDPEALNQLLVQHGMLEP